VTNFFNYVTTFKSSRQKDEVAHVVMWGGGWFFKGEMKAFEQHIALERYL